MSVSTEQHRYNFIDLFAGAGGLSEGFVQAGFKPIAHVEMNEFAAKTLETRSAYYYLKDTDNLGIYTKSLTGNALLTAPELLLLDEPLASLDIPRKRELLPYLQRLTREINIPMLYVSHSLDEILHLADKVLVLEEGSVKAFGNLEEVWGSSVMHPWLPREQQSSILKVSVLEHHPHYAMTALALGDQHLWVNKINKPLQSALRIRIQASDVSLVLQPPLQTSIRNILRAKVAECFDDNGQVEVKLEVGSRTLWARISPWARDELGIKPGLWLYAQIKSVSITA